MDTPKRGAIAPRTEDGARYQAPPRDEPAVPAQVPALHTSERPHDGADEQTTAALGDLMPTPGE